MQPELALSSRGKNSSSFDEVRRLKSLCKRNGLLPIKLTGAYYCISDNQKYFNLNFKII